MEIKLKLNGKAIVASVEADTVLLDFLREKGCLSRPGYADHQRESGGFCRLCSRERPH